MKILIMAGGSGERLWPLSRIDYPKQLLELFNGQSLLQTTIARFLKKYSPDDIYVLTNPALYQLVKKQVEQLCPALAQNILLEPEKKNTGPAIALALKFFEGKQLEEDEIFLFCPADSYISPEETFLQLLDRASSLALNGQIVTFGVSPYKPETGYGYIRFQGEHQVDRFIEKPDQKTAEEFVQEGSYLWNCGIFLISKETFSSEAKMYAPEIYELMQGSYEDVFKNFGKMPSLSVDRAIVEKSKRVSVVQMDLIWGDVGSWDSVYDLSEKDRNGNVKKGEATCINASNNLIFAQSRHVAISGIEEVIIVETKDAIYIGKLNQSQKMKKIVQELKDTNNTTLLESTRSERPWGFFETIERGNGYKVKKIHVLPHQKLSLQYHNYRSEHWVVVNGEACVTKGENLLTLRSGESTYIEKKELHRITNTSDQVLEIIETQLGDKLDENDIVRIEDDYGRATEKQIYASG